MSEMRPYSTTDRQIGSECGWESCIHTSHRHLQQSLDCAWRTNGLASQVTGNHTNGILPIGPHYRPELHVAIWLWKGSYCPYFWGSNKHQAATWHFWALTSLSATYLSAVYRGRWRYVWTFALNWYVTQPLFFRILQCFCLFSNLSQTQSDGP